MRIDSISNSLYAQTIMNAGRSANSAQVSESKAQQSEIAPPENGLTGPEQAFFAKLFPGSVHQLNAQMTYSPSGANASVELGQIINRKG